MDLPNEDKAGQDKYGAEELENGKKEKKKKKKKKRGGVEENGE